MAAESETGGSTRFDEFIARFEAAWRTGARPDLQEFIAEASDEPNLSDLIEGLVLIDLEWRYRTGVDEPKNLEAYADQVNELGSLERISMWLVKEEYRARHYWGDKPSHAEYQQRFAERWDELQQALVTIDQELARGVSNEPRAGDRLGRYRILRRVGSGGFGIVFLGHDEELSRDVAVKVPFRERLSTSEAAEQFLSEARTIAGLDHPSIVPVYDVGEQSGTFYVVSKYINGSELTSRIEAGFPSFRALTEIVASVADGLHHAHLRGITHRDVKPANILLDENDRAYVTDFGLAVRDADVSLDQQVVGTPAYMSPEQARGEGHRVDGRTDVFSLGVVLYELLTKRRPFRGDSGREILELVKHVEPRPPRQLDDAIPRELERICLKALSKRVNDRYPTAGDMATELRRWRSSRTERITPAGSTVRVAGGGGTAPRDALAEGIATD